MSIKISFLRRSALVRLLVEQSAVNPMFEGSNLAFTDTGWKWQKMVVFKYEGTSGISAEISELRHNLDQSLYNVSSSAESRLDSQVLDRETGRLNLTVDRYGSDLVSKS